MDCKLYTKLEAAVFQVMLLGDMTVNERKMEDSVSRKIGRYFCVMNEPTKSIDCTKIYSRLTIKQQTVSNLNFLKENIGKHSALSESQRFVCLKCNIKWIPLVALRCSATVIEKRFEAPITFY